MRKSMRRKIRGQKEICPHSFVFCVTNQKVFLCKMPKSSAGGGGGGA